jgi:hypothetical protein
MMIEANSSEIERLTMKSTVSADSLKSLINSIPAVYHFIYMITIAKVIFLVVGPQYEYLMVI